jgi:hypothetical protein
VAVGGVGDSASERWAFSAPPGKQLKIYATALVYGFMRPAPVIYRMSQGASDANDG